jgi:glyoxylase I family protein
MTAENCGRPMKIEHVAFQAEDPAAVAQWYVAHLGCQVKRSSGPPAHAHFLADSTGSVMVEIYNHPRVKTPDYRNMDALLLHLAFCSDDPAADRDRLISAGASVEEDVTGNPAGDSLVMLRDPWGFAIQLVRRGKSML